MYLRDGVFFEKGEGGSVNIVRRSGPLVTDPILDRVFISSDEWDSIVLAMSPAEKKPRPAPGRRKPLAEEESE